MRFRCECPEPLDSPNPRRAECNRCLGYIDPAWKSSDSNVTQFFSRLTDCRNLPVTFPNFEGHCIKRERAGRSTFGFRYLARDNISEALEEAADLGLYAYLDGLQARRAGNEDDGRDLALMAAYHASLAYDYLLRLQSKRGGAP